RLRPHAGFHDHLTDVKRVLAWVREHGPRYGADPGTLVLAGGSAGAHLATIAALTQHDPRYQPGFEDADTSVSAVVGLYGWYGGYYEEGGPASEAGRSEEHTSELQSRENLVCRLLLEKKKRTN